MFKTEHELVGLFTSDIQAFSLAQLRRQNHHIDYLLEVDLGHGVADIVLYSHATCPTDRKMRLDKFDIQIYSILQERRCALTLFDIQDTTKSSSQKVSQSVRKLTEEGFVEPISDAFKVSRRYEAHAQTIVAIEAKLTNWKRAISQAYKYHWFSHYSFVLLPESQVRSAKENLDRFKRLKVGLASIDSEGRVELIYTPPRRKPYSPSMEMQLNESVLHQWREKLQPRAEVLVPLFVE